MREPHKKGVAHHFGSESCVWVRKDAEEALTGESAEGRRATKGNAPQAHSRRTQSRGCESQGLWRVRQAARRDRRRRFTAASSRDAGVAQGELLGIESQSGAGH